MEAFEFLRILEFSKFGSCEFWKFWKFEKPRDYFYHKFFFIYYYYLFIIIFYYLQKWSQNDMQGNLGDCTDEMVTYILGHKDPVHKFLVTQVHW